MSKSQLFIPKKLKVGFQQRKDTYEGYLAYVIYYDAVGKLRKEASWESWRHKVDGSHLHGNSKRLEDLRLTPQEVDNVPTKGFVLNKGVGGVRGSWSRNARNEYIRVWDPRGIEFEISVPNLLFILMHTNCVKRQLEGEFVYSWDGKELVLLPVNTDEYRASTEYTKLQGKKIGARDLVEGHLYETKNQETVVFLGRFDFHHIARAPTSSKRVYKSEKRRIFVDPDGKNLRYMSNVGFLSRKVGGMVGDYAELLERYKESVYSSKVVGTVLKTVDALSEMGKWKHGHWSDPRSDVFVKKGENRYDILTVIGDTGGDGAYEDRVDVPRQYRIIRNGTLSFNFDAENPCINKNNLFSSPGYHSVGGYWDERKQRMAAVSIVEGISAEDLNEEVNRLDAGLVYWVKENGAETLFNNKYDLSI
jgi:hypothetical protein